MATITISYQFDSYEDAEELRELMRHKEIARVLHEFKDYLRSLEKYSDSDTVKIEEVNNKFWQIIEDNELIL
ncbi:hypothetical protein LLG34_04345 [bacterium]|nr:hypothetical protein [bacterium]